MEQRCNGWVQRGGADRFGSRDALIKANFTLKCGAHRQLRACAADQRLWLLLHSVANVRCSQWLDSVSGSIYRRERVSGCTLLGRMDTGHGGMVILLQHLCSLAQHTQHSSSLILLTSVNTLHIKHICYRRMVRIPY